MMTEQMEQAMLTLASEDPGLIDRIPVVEKFIAYMRQQATEEENNLPPIDNMKVTIEYAKSLDLNDAEILAALMACAAQPYG